MAQLQRLVITDAQYLKQTEQTEQSIVLSARQQHYLLRVLRLHAGDQFIAITAKGWRLAELQTDQLARLLEPIPTQTELPVAVILLIALPKTGMDDVVRQATEIGIAKIQPILSERTVLNPNAQKLDRWQRIAQEAAEQCERQVVPEVLSPLSWQMALPVWNADQATCYLCQARGDYPHLLNCLSEGMNTKLHDSILIAVGAEGGWTDAEIAQAVEVGYQPVTLGARILRSVTAPLVALALIAAMLEAQNGNQA